MPIKEACVLQVIEEMYNAKGHITKDQVKQWAAVLETSYTALYEDIYEQCCEIIKPIVDEGKVPGSVVETLEILVEDYLENNK